MKQILFFTMIIFYLNSYSQLQKNIHTNITLDSIKKYYFYEQIRPYEKHDYIYLAYTGGASDMPNGVLIGLKKSGKVKNAIKLNYGLNDSTQWKSRICLEHKRIKLFLNTSIKKSINQYLMQVNWSQYRNICDSNFYCGAYKNNNENYLQKVDNLIKTDDGESRTIIIKFKNKIQVINLYMWSNFLEFCDLESHIMIDKLQKELFRLKP